MREIKFRLTYQRDETGRIVQTYISLDELMYCAQAEGVTSTKILPMGQYGLIGRDEYTGRRDIDGKEIYEGDRVDIWLDIKTVVWADDTACFECISSHGSRGLYGYMEDKEGIRVVGNIYENPELTQKGEKR